MDSRTLSVLGEKKTIAVSAAWMLVFWLTMLCAGTAVAEMVEIAATAKYQATDRHGKPSALYEDEDSAINAVLPSFVEIYYFPPWTSYYEFPAVVGKSPWQKKISGYWSLDRAVYLQQKVRSFSNDGRYYEQFIYPNTYVELFYNCPVGYEFKQSWFTWNIGDVGPTCVATTFKDKDKCDLTVGNPIQVGTSNKFATEVDYRGGGAFPLEFRRHYNSSSYSEWVKYPTAGARWRHNYSNFIKYYASGSIATAYVYRDKVAPTYFTLINGLWTPDSDITDKLVRLTDTTGTLTGWRYTNSDDEVELYDAAGKLLSITNRAGLTQTLSYDASGRLVTVADPFGRALTFTYDASNRIATMTDPAGKLYSYAYDANNNLISVTYPDGKSKTYLYENTSFPHALTGIVDENGARFATYAYDAQGRAISSEHAGGVEKVSLVYNTDTSTTVTDSLGAVRTYRFQTILGVVKNTAIEGPACTSCGANASAATSYDANGNVASRTDFNGNVTTYTYDLSRNLETSRTEAAGTSLARTISTEWHPTFRLPTKITEPNRVTTLGYDASGNLTQKTVTAGALTRTWRYTYNANGQMTLSDGPRTDATDTTTYVYNASGNLTTTLNALNQITQITAYDPHGQPLTVQDPNGLVTNLSYDLRGRLVSRSIGGEVTSYQYDGVGNLLKTTLPDGSFMSFTYDAAHRLTQITDQLGNRIVYTLDAMGNRTKEDIYDPSNALSQTRSRVFNQLSRLAQDIGAQAQTTNYQYDNNGNRTQVTDPLNHTTSNSYDNLNRLIQVTDPNNGLIRYSYDANDQLTQVTDPKGLVTTYSYDGLGNRTQVSSPDSGVTVNTYDSAGNLQSQKDARNLTTTYSYDALNRITQATYADGTSTTYQYDTGVNSIGRLNKITDPSGATQWSYDARGRVIQKQQQTGAVTQTLSYSYNAQGQLSSMTYPSGKVINYSYTLAKLSSLSLGTTPLLSTLQYQPFGPPKAWNWGNNTLYNRSYDQDGRLTGYPLGSGTRTLGYDAASRITAYTESTAANNQTFGYDNLDRLTNFTGLSTTHSYSYDSDGNRLSQTIGASSSNYTYPTTSNRLNQVTGSSPKTFSYDAMGNQTSDGALTYTYNARGRLSGANGHSYVINGLGQRVSKSGSTITTGSTLFLYDEQGHLLGEYHATGQAVRETVYLGDTPVAVLSTGSSIPPATPTDTVWVDDSLPAGATPNAVMTYDEPWTWVSSNPTPYSGTLAHQSKLQGGFHQHYFSNAIATLSIAPGDTLYAYVYLDPANLPSEVMLQWGDSTGSWEHRAYWGANSIAGGVNGTNSRRYMGAMPAKGQWIKLAVPASQVGLEGKIVKGMAFTLYSGRATWDKAGKVSSGAPVNVALASNGAIATASSTASSTDFPTGGAINGDHRGVNWSTGGGWRDATAGVYPDWLQIDFNDQKTINEIDVYTLQDNYTSPVEPTETLTFSQYGLIAFDVQYWTGTAWATIPNGNVTGNNKVWRKFTFSDITTSKIRVVVNNASATYSRIVEVEAYSPATTSTTTTQATYYVQSDHLNTPRVLSDSTNKVIWRWDSDPFGSTAANEDPDGDGVKFTYNLRFPGQYYDRETGLHYNYFRDYDPKIGRYVESDPIGLEGGVNTYAYVLNNPARWKDPSGLKTCGSGWNDYIVPDNPLGYPFSGCCQVHDDCYDDCKNLPTKSECDFRLWNCATAKCRKYGGAIRTFCEKLASDYAGVVANSDMAQTAFDDARKKCPKCQAR